MVNCKCGEEISMSNCNFYEDEIICESCGCVYGLEYLGAYEQGSDERMDAGFESDSWKKEFKRIKEMNEND